MVRNLTPARGGVLLAGILALGAPPAIDAFLEHTPRSIQEVRLGSPEVRTVALIDAHHNPISCQGVPAEDFFYRFSCEDVDISTITLMDVEDGELALRRMVRAGSEFTQMPTEQVEKDGPVLLLETSEISARGLERDGDMIVVLLRGSGRATLATDVENSLKEDA